MFEAEKKVFWRLFVELLVKAIALDCRVGSKGQVLGSGFRIRFQGEV